MATENRVPNFAYPGILTDLGSATQKYLSLEREEMDPEALENVHKLIKALAETSGLIPKTVPVVEQTAVNVDFVNGNEVEEVA